MKRWFILAAVRARGQSNDLNRGILASNLFNCHNEVINAPPIPSISRCIHIVYRHKKVWEYQRSNFIYNCMSTFLHCVRCKDALLDCSAPGGERCEIGSDNSLSPGRRQAIIWTNAGILLIGPWGTNFSENLIDIHTFSFKKIHLKMSSAKWRPFVSASMC